MNIIFYISFIEFIDPLLISKRDKDLVATKWIDKYRYDTTQNIHISNADIITRCNNLFFVSWLLGGKNYYYYYDNYYYYYYDKSYWRV